ncbi:MAG: endonuclease/exonuclease/phosphatase family protein [Puniceicoccaceae bacterium]|nr:MAG: endonuclease/exonuclease/phosphatase family protein [Puniceicoccaceae bacterium]
MPMTILTKHFTIMSLLTLMLTVSLAATEIRVVAWNIEWFPGQQFRGATPEEERAQMAVVQEELKHMNPDVLLASEIRDWRSFSEAISVIPELEVANVSHFVDRDEGILWRQQLAIGSRLPIIAAYAEPFQQTLTAMVRGFSFAAIALPDSDDVVLFYAVHLKSNRSWNEQQAAVNFRIRDESIVQILQHVDQMERLMWRGRVAGVVIGGDINTNEDGQFDDRVVEMLVDAGFRNSWANVPREKRLSWRGSDRFEATTFDYIFTRGDRLRHGDAILIEVPEEASDHHAVGLVITVED